MRIIYHFGIFFNGNDYKKGGGFLNLFGLILAAFYEVLINIISEYFNITYKLPKTLHLSALTHNLQNQNPCPFISYLAHAEMVVMFSGFVLQQPPINRAPHSYQ